jgi:hypothetical protein
MMKDLQNLILIAVAIFMSACSAVYAQKGDVDVRLNVLGGVGTTWHTISFESPNSYDVKNIAFSGGGGIGLELGVGFTVIPKLFIETSAAYQQVMGLQSENGYTSSVFFNRKTFLLGAKYKFPLNKKSNPLSFNLGGGTGYIIPGALHIKENDDDQGKIGYNNCITFYGLSEIEIPIRSKAINVGLRFRKASFTAETYTKAPVRTVQSEYRNFKASGFDILAGFVF